MFTLDLCCSSIIYSKKIIQIHYSFVSSEAGTLNRVLCSSVQSKAEQLTCFAQTFAMALELVHCCRLGGNMQIKGQ